MNLLPALTPELMEMVLKVRAYMCTESAIASSVLDIMAGEQMVYVLVGFAPRDCGMPLQCPKSTSVADDAPVEHRIAWLCLVLYSTDGCISAQHGIHSPVCGEGTLQTLLLTQYYHY